MKVREVMSAESVVSIAPDETLALASQLLLGAGVRHLPVVRDGGVIGVLTERDIFRRNGEVGAGVAAREPVEAAMRSPAITIGPDEPLINAVTLMVRRKVGCLPVVSERGLVGMLTTTDVLRHDLETAIDRPADHLPPSLRSVMKRATGVRPAMELLDAAALMSARRIRHLPVLDAEGKVVGILSDRDVRAALGDPRRFLADYSSRDRSGGPLVGEVMSKVVITLNQNAPLTTAVEHLVHEGMGALPIVDDRQHLVGIVSYLDVIQALR
jgi:CBS domain-containing protein